MANIENLFSKFDDLTKTKYTTDCEKEKYQFSTTPALSQGKKFKKYQKQIKINLEKENEREHKIEKENDNYMNNFTEGFQVPSGLQLQENGLTIQSKNIIQQNDYSSQKSTLDNLKQMYKSTLQQYQNVYAKISGSARGYLDRVDHNNPYLNKTVKFTTGQLAYVTNQGVVKYIENISILKSVNIPQEPVQLNIAWDESWNVGAPGTQIPTTPTLILGTPLKTGQSIGNEGSNIFVNQLIDNPTPTYMGCFSDSDSSNKTMTFIGGSPSSANISITNGTFLQPQITNDSYQYINSSSNVPGWTFNAVLVNESNVWGYPTPYPAGNQCACIQQTQSISQNINLVSGVTYNLSLVSCGRDCCDGSGKSNPINIVLSNTDDTNSKNIYSFTAPINKWTNYSTPFTVSNTQMYKISFNGTWSKGDRSTAIQNIKLNSDSNGLGGSYSYNQCKQSAINGGWRYFALQNVNITDSKGFCAVSNSEPSVTHLGIGYTPNGIYVVWSSNTGGQPGNMATLTNTGSLSVVNHSGASIFSTPNDAAQPSNYLGCYGDAPNRAMSLFNGGASQYNLQQCQEQANKNGDTYFGLQDSTSGTNAQCALSSDINQTIKYGKAGNCTKLPSGSWSGGGWSNAVYSTSNPSSTYYLILQDDGNMCIYRGTGPQDNQGLIWSSNTRGKQQNYNASMTSTKGKYGKNWIPSGSTLAIGEFVGSNNGNLALVMTSSGDLALYTYTNVVNCQKMRDGNIGGGMGANAAYDIGKTAASTNMSKVAFVDQDSNLHVYSSDNVELTNSYTKMNNIDAQNNDIIDGAAAYDGNSVEKCQTSCDNDSKCYGFVFDNQHKSCRPKNKNMYPYGGSIINAQGIDTYIRDKKPLKPPAGIPFTTENIDTIKYNKYIDGGKFKAEYGIADATRIQKKQLSKLQTQMNMLSTRISNFTGKFGDGSNTAERQSSKNVQGIKDYLSELYSTDKKIIDFNSNTNSDNILKDSDIVVLQKNYDYLFWSILAAGTVLITMNIVKK